MQKHIVKKILIALLCSFGVINNGFAQFAGNINVGAGQTYTTLTGADGIFNALNTGNVTGNITIQITSNITEPGTIGLNKWVETGAGNYQLKIVPDGTTERVLSCSATNMINLSNVRNVVVDGSFAGTGKFLRFISTNKNANTLVFLNDCKSDTIRNCYFEGVDTATNKSIILIGTTNIPGGTGNDSIVILNNVIKDNAAGYPKNLIRSVGTTAAANDNCIISGNEFINWGNDAVGLAAGTGDNWRILNNAFYQTPAAIINTTIYGIRAIVNSGNGHTISGNSIGGRAPDRSGAAMTTNLSTYNNASASVAGIYLAGSGSALNPVIISKNNISNISAGINGPQINGILLTSETNAIVDSNCIEDIIPSSNVQNAYGILAYDVSVKITNNIIKKIIGYTSLSSVSNCNAKGIHVAGVNRNFLVDHNLIDSVLNDCSRAAGNSDYNSTPTGIIAITPNSSSGKCIISNNKISNIINTYKGTAVGIKIGEISNFATNIIFNNQINNIGGLYNSNTISGNMLIGIQNISSTSLFSDSIYNNVINIGELSYHTTIIYGIQDTGGSANRFYSNNTVNITGSSQPLDATTATTAAFYKSNSGTSVLKNNIFNNTKTTTNTNSNPLTSRNFSIKNTASSDKLKSNYNLLFTADSICAMWGTSPKNFTDWKTISNGDTNSLNAPVTFVSATDLHIEGTNANAWNVYGRGIAIPTINKDIDGDNRSTIGGTFVTIGADEIPTPTSTPLAINLKTITAKNVGNKNRIDWSTAEEGKTDYFELESSTDARNFKKIAKINARGQASTYTYWDEKANLGMNYYRLKMTINNGQFVYSKTVSAEVKSLSDFAMSIYPNPVQGKAVLQINGNMQRNAVINIMDVTGKLLHTLKVTSNETEIDMNQFTYGIYIIKYSDDQQNQTIKIIKQ